MKTTKLISRAIVAIVAACLCLGMAACGDDDNPFGEGGGPGSELKIESVAIPFMNLRDPYQFTYNADGSINDIRGYLHSVGHESFQRGGSFRYEVNVPGGSTIYTSAHDSGSDSYACEVSPEGLVTHMDNTNNDTWDYTYGKNGEMTKIVMNDPERKRVTEFTITWKNGNITRIEAVENEGAGSMYTYTYKYTSYPSSRGIVYSHFMNLTPLLRPTNLNGDEYMDFFANLTGYFGQRPKNLLSSVTKTYNNGTKKGTSTTLHIDYTFYEAPHPSEGFVYQISLSDQDSAIEIVWEEPEEQL